MHLTRVEEDMLMGRQGRGPQLAMEIIVKLGELYGADDLIPVSQAHIDGCLYAAVGEAGLLFAEKLDQLGAKVAIPTSLNATSCDVDNWREHGVDPAFAEKSSQLEKHYLNMGALPTWTCAPYHFGLVPRFGEQIAWAESNAIVYANSVIGARTERYGDYTDICCAITGRVPEFGLHKRENRAGQILIDCSFLDLKPTTENFAVLGYLAGEIAKDKIPVLKGIPSWVSRDHLKAFCAAIASSGAVALFHMTGITPEALDEKAAFQGRKPLEVYELSQKMLLEAEGTLSNICTCHVDAAVIGCPHASAAEILELARLMVNKRVKKNKQLWVYTSRSVYSWLSLKGTVDELKEKGVIFFRDTCFVNTSLGSWEFQNAATNSAKYAHYIPGRTGLNAVFANLERCIDMVAE